MKTINCFKNEVTLKNMLLFFLCLLISLTFSACEKETAEIEYEIPTSLDFDAVGGEKSFKIYAKFPATIESVKSSDAWCQVYTSGESPVNVIVKVDANTGGVRNTSIVVKLKSGKNKESTNVHISQKEDKNGNGNDDGNGKENHFSYNGIKQTITRAALTITDTYAINPSYQCNLHVVLDNPATGYKITFLTSSMTRLDDIQSGLYVYGTERYASFLQFYYPMIKCPEYQGTWVSGCDGNIIIQNNGNECEIIIDWMYQGNSVTAYYKGALPITRKVFDGTK